MDFAFAPGGDPKYDDAIRTLFRDRKVPGRFETTLVHDPTRLKDLAAFFGELSTTITNPPIGDILIGSHANDRGQLHIDLDGGGAAHVDYQVVKKILADPSRMAKLQIPPALYRLPNGSNAPIKLHFKGCRIGVATKLVDALKQVFGAVVPVTAPRHFHVVHLWRQPKTTDFPGTFEYLDYTTFKVTDKKKLDPPTVVTKFEQLSANATTAPTFIDGTVVSKDMWKLLVPPQPKSDHEELTFSTQLGRSIKKRKTWPATGQYRVDMVQTFFKKRNPAPGDKTITQLKADVAASPMYQAGWGFPLHEQFGHKTTDEYVDAFDWLPTDEVDSGDPILAWYGTRYEHVLLVPITDPPPSIEGTGKKARVKFGKLIYNFYPHGTGGPTAINELLDSDARLFYTTP